MAFDLIAFDADDTLWHNERSYRDARDQFCRMLSGAGVALSAEEIDAHVNRTEVANIQYYGYGVSSFIMSLIETALDLTGGRVTGGDLRGLIELAKAMLTEDDGALSRRARAPGLARGALSPDAHHQGTAPAPDVEAGSLGTARVFPVRRGRQPQDAGGLRRHPRAARCGAGALPDDRQLAPIRHPAGARDGRVGRARAGRAELVARGRRHPRRSQSRATSSWPRSIACPRSSRPSSRR